MTAKTTTTAATVQHITINIGPGPNSIATLRLEGPTLTESEMAYLRSLLEAEDGETLRTIAAWLSYTRNITLRLGGAHHEVEIEEDDEGREMTRCLSCGRHYRWRVRCPGNREGLV